MGIHRVVWVLPQIPGSRERGAFSLNLYIPVSFQSDNERHDLHHGPHARTRPGKGWDPMIQNVPPGMRVRTDDGFSVLDVFIVLLARKKRIAVHFLAATAVAVGL